MNLIDFGVITLNCFGVESQMPMLRTSSEAFPASKKVLKDIPYVLRVEFRDLARDVTKIVGKPIACHKCNGFLISVDQIKENPKIGKHFICPFCSTLNVIEGEVVFAGNESDFVISPAPEQTDTVTDAVPVGGKSFIALIDVSGSMSGVNLSAVKRSLSTSIESLAANSPDTMFGLIEFESSVVFRNLQTGEPIVLPRETYASLDSIVESTKSLLDKFNLVHIGKNSEKVKQHVQALRDMGGTALGPAVAMAYVIAKHRNVGRVVILTDGLANEGIGALEGYQVTPASKFYESIGSMFSELGTAIDVVGIASGAGMELKTLGLMPEATNGQMYYVTPNELDRSLSRLAGASLLGRDVEVRLITPAGVKLKDASGISHAVIEDLKKKSESKIAVVGNEHELYVEVEPEDEIEQEEIPIQVQVAYTDETGARRLRSVTTRLKVADKEEEIIDTLDPTVGATFVTQKAGEESFRGDRASGRERIASFRSALKKREMKAPKKIKKAFDKIERALEKEEAEIEHQEKKLKAASASAPSEVSDEAFTESLAQMRRSSREMFEEDEEE
ncbi:MAG: VWA domain-containing protein [Candidatus Lokiarchaeota archaeon]|nr:VWA domain-containing protein [Candidatus Lokiarchaeota archaeon]